MSYVIESKDRDKNKQHKGLKDLSLEIDQELKYIEKHVKRMTESGGFKRSFIKGNVRIKVNNIL
jgi:hypothetical protein